MEDAILVPVKGMRSPVRTETQWARFISLSWAVSPSRRWAASQRFSDPKGRALLAYLTLEADLAHNRSSLAGLLWPDIPERQARSNLRNTLYRLRKTLDQAAADITPFSSSPRLTPLL